MFELLLQELKITILNKYLTKSEACLMRISNKNILLEINFIFEEIIKNGMGKKICSKISTIFNSSYYITKFDINIIWETPLESICICKKKTS